MFHSGNETLTCTIVMDIWFIDYVANISYNYRLVYNAREK